MAGKHRLTTYQKRLLTRLQRGQSLESTLGGWIDPLARRRLKAATEDALIATGKLMEVTVRGNHLLYHRILHKDHLEEYVKQLNKLGRRVLRTKELK